MPIIPLAHLTWVRAVREIMMIRAVCFSIESADAGRLLVPVGEHVVVVIVLTSSWRLLLFALRGSLAAAIVLVGFFPVHFLLFVIPICVCKDAASS